MDVVSLSCRSERVTIDRDRMSRLYRRLGTAAAQSFVELALEELAFWLYHCRGSDDAEAQRTAARRVDRLARMTGLVSVAEVAGQLVDPPPSVPAEARAAIAARLTRLGERSILALWNGDDISP